MLNSRNRSWRLTAFALLALAVSPALAQQPQQPRLLDVPATAAWQHAATQIILRPEAAGLRRVEVRDTTSGELDIIANYANQADGVVASVYLYRTSVPDVALWFDRALTAIRLQPQWGLETAATPAVTAFTRPGASVASGLRTSFDIARPGARSTAVAIAPLGDYLFKVRISSARLDAAALDALMTRFVESMGWPAAAAERVATPIEPCPEPLRLRQARLVRDDMSDVLMNLLTGVVAEDAERPAVTYCREPGANAQHGVYRPDASRNAYLIALGDAGIALDVGQAMQIEGLGGGGGRRFSMRLLDRGTTSALPSFNRLPPPEQAMAVAFGHRGETISVSTDDDNER
jgi:hypothetical protein